MNRARTYIFSIFLTLIWVTGAAAQGPGVEWMYTYGGTNDEQVFAADTTGDGYIITGKTSSYGGGNADVYVLKTDLDGDSLWMTVWGTSRQEWGRDVITCSSGGYAMAGIERLAQPSQPQVVFHRLNAAGTIINTKNYGHIGDDRSWSIDETTDGGFVIAGYTDVMNSGQTYVYLIRTDANGDTLWTNVYGGPEDDEGHHAEQTTDGGFIITGGTNSFGGGANWDVYLIKTDAVGDTIWTRRYGGTEYDIGYCVHQTRDGGFVVCGATASYGAGLHDFYLIKTDAVGDTLWTRTYGGYHYDYAHAVVEINNGYTMVGYSQSFGGTDNDMYLVRTDLMGDVSWTEVIGGDGQDYGYDIVPAPDGGYVATGHTNSWSSGDNNAWLVKLNPDPTGIKTDAPHAPLLLTSHPNPFNPITTITYQLPVECRATISVYDATGRIVATLFDDVKDAGYHSLSWDAPGVSSGVYFVRLRAMDRTQTVKLVLLK